MNHRIVTSANGIDSASWERFVKNHPKGNIFQDPIMYAAQEGIANHSPFVFSAYDGVQIVGILSGVVINEYSGFIGDLSSRAIVFGGPLVNEADNSIGTLLLRCYEESLRKKVVYSQFRNLFEMDWIKTTMAGMGFHYEDHLNIVIDLNESEEEIWKRIHSKRRNEIRRAKKEGTTFKVREDASALERAYDILNEVYHHARLPLPDLNLFRAIYSRSTSKKGLKIFAAEHGGEMIGVMLALVYKDRIYDWYAGSYRRYYDKYPNDLIPWEAMLWGKANGYNIFDFGGAGKPGVSYGVRDYKMKFGGQLVNFGRFQKAHRPMVMKIAKTGFKAWQIVKKVT